MYKDPFAIVDESRREEFRKRLHLTNKTLQYDGFIPKSWMWILTKIAIMLNVGEELNIDLKFLDKGYARIAGFLKGKKWLRRYAVLKAINKIVNFMRQLRQYYWMDGLKLWIKPSDKMGEIVLDYQLLDTWEPETTAIVKREVKPGMTCIDIGASIGYFTMQFGRLVGKDGHVISVEPTDFQQPYLNRNIKNNGLEDIVEVWNVGAWDKTAILPMPVNAPPYVQTLINCMRVDDIVAGRKVDFIKLDCDGPEPKVLRGLEQTFQNNPNLKMVVEYYPKYIKDAGLDPNEFKEVIDKYFEFEVIPGDYTDGCWNLYCKRHEHAKNKWPDMAV